MDSRSLLYQRDIPMSATDWLVDAVVALGAFGFGLLQMSASVNLFIPDDFIRQVLGVRAVTLSGWGIAMVALTCAPLVVRRRLPWLVLAVCAAFWAFFEVQLGVSSLSLVGPLIALFTVAYERPRGEALAAGVGLLAVVALCALGARTSSLTMLMLVQNVAVVVAVALAGVALHARQESMQAVEARAAEAERTREAHAERRVEEERLRIAREVHDITAHSLSAVSIQAAAASALVDADPAAAKEALASIRETAKGALDEMRGIIAVLRDGSADAQTQPLMGTRDMTALIEYLEQAGVAATLRVEGEAPLPAYIDMALYGIAREAATNIVRHAGAAHASIELAVDASGARLTIRDDGCGMADAAQQGHGIEGMRERVKVLGGTFEMGPATGGGTRIAVRIPRVPLNG